MKRLDDAYAVMCSFGIVAFYHLHGWRWMTMLLGDFFGHHS